MRNSPHIKIALVDDHKLFRRGLISLIKTIGDNYEIIFEANDGIELEEAFSKNKIPDILIIDVNMPRRDGVNTAKWLNEHYPNVNVLVLSMVEKEEIVVKMLKLGVKGYLCKDVEPEELKQALDEIYKKGFYYTDFLTGKLVHSIRHPESSEKQKLYDTLKLREKEFLELACSEMTYSQIADKMYLSPKTIDGYRNSLFEKLNVKSRVGLAIFAIKNEWVLI